MTTNTKTSKSGTIEVVPSDPAEDRENAIDRLAGLLPRDELEDALKGLDPEQITGPGGLLSQLAGRVIETALGLHLLAGRPVADVPGAARRRLAGRVAEMLGQLGAS